MENNNKKELTLDDLANLITETRTSLEKKIDSAVEDIATKTQSEFLKINERFDKVNERFDKVDRKFDGVDKRFDEVNSKIDTLEFEVKSRRVHIFTHKELEHRVEKLEDNWKKYKPMIQKTAKC